MIVRLSLSSVSGISKLDVRKRQIESGIFGLILATQDPVAKDNMKPGDVYNMLEGDST